MRKVSILILSLFTCVLLSSCSKQWCSTHYPVSVDSVYKYVTKDSIIIKDTTIYLYLPGEIVYDSIQIPCPDPGPAYIPKRVTAETSLARAEAWWQYPNIKLLLIQKDSTIEVRLAGALQKAYYWESEYNKITVKPEPEKYIPGIYKVAFWMWIGVIVAGLGYVLIRLLVLKR